MAVKQPATDAPYPPLEAWAEEMLGAFRRVAERQIAAPASAVRPLTAKALDAADSFLELERRLEIPPAP